MLSKNLESSWQPWSWMGAVSQMLHICTLEIAPGNMMLWGSVLFVVFIYLWTTFAKFRKTPEWPLCVFIASCVICCGVGILWQPSNGMCDVMLFVNVPIFCRNLCTTQHEITFQHTIILSICLKQHLEPPDKVK